MSVGYAAAMDAALQGEHSPGGASNHYGATPHPDGDETTPSDVSERPSVDDVESETGSTGALETRSLKDHKGESAQPPVMPRVSISLPIHHVFSYACRTTVSRFYVAKDVTIIMLNNIIMKDYAEEKSPL